MGPISHRRKESGGVPSYPDGDLGQALSKAGSGGLCQASASPADGAPGGAPGSGLFQTDACQPFNICTTFDQIRETAKRLENVIIEQQSFEVLIPHYDREDAFFYLDPPYFSSEYVYDVGFGWEQHVLMRDILAAGAGKESTGTAVYERDAGAAQ